MVASISVGLVVLVSCIHLCQFWLQVITRTLPAFGRWAKRFASGLCPWQLFGAARQYPRFQRFVLQPRLPAALAAYFISTFGLVPLR